MRITLSALFVLTIAGLAPGHAATQNANSTKTAYHYETCSCHFGYGNVCLVTASCDSGGGHCVATCTPPTDEGLTNR
jgi:hypothetical protein